MVAWWSLGGPVRGFDIWSIALRVFWMKSMGGFDQSTLPPSCLWASLDLLKAYGGRKNSCLDGLLHSTLAFSWLWTLRHLTLDLLSVWNVDRLPTLLSHPPDSGTGQTLTNPWFNSINHSCVHTPLGFCVSGEPWLIRPSAESTRPLWLSQSTTSSVTRFYKKAVIKRSRGLRWFSLHGTGYGSETSRHKALLSEKSVRGNVNLCRFLCWNGIIV